MAIGNYHDSGNTYMIRTPLGFLAAFFDRLGRYEPAATIAGFVVTSPLAALPVMAEFGTAIAHLRDVLGEATYESLARKGASQRGQRRAFGCTRSDGLAPRPDPPAEFVSSARTGHIWRVRTVCDARPPPILALMHITVDYDSCEGHGQCLSGCSRRRVRHPRRC